jgi:hypothetical protein
MRYFKGRWEENRGDEFASWGCSDWYFEVLPDNSVVRQMEVYDSGAVLQYDQQHIDDRFGMLTDQPFDAEGFPCSQITADEFLSMWKAYAPANRKADA